MTTCIGCKGTYGEPHLPFVDGLCEHCQRKAKYGAFQIKATLRDARNGNVVTVEEEWIRNGDEEQEEYRVIEFLWTEGNYGCDCNRSIFMYPDDESMHLECGDSTIQLVELLVDGQQMETDAP